MNDLVLIFVIGFLSGFLLNLLISIAVLIHYRDRILKYVADNFIGGIL